MKPRLLSLFVIVVCVFSAGIAVASGGETPRPPARPPSTPVAPMEFAPAAPPGPAGQMLGAADADAGAIAAPALGQPGTNFRYVQTFGATDVGYFDDPAHLNGPYGLGADGTNVWIVEGDGRRALKYTSSGGFIMQIGQAAFQQGISGTTVSYPYDVAVDAGGNVWLVDQGAHHLMKFNSGGQLLSELGSMWNPGDDNTQFNTPSGIAFDSLGNIYVSDTNNHRIQVFDSAGAYRATIGVSGNSGSDNARFNGPVHITISGSLLYVADANNHRVQIFNITNPQSASYVATLGASGAPGGDNAHFNSPQGVAIDLVQQRIFVADGYNWRVQVFDLNTRVYEGTLTGFSFVSDVAVDSAGNLYVADPWLSQDDVQQFNSSLTFVRRYGTYGVPYLTDDFHYNRPAAVAVASDGSLYIGEGNGRRVVKLNAAGTVQWIKGVAGVWGSDNAQFASVEGLALDSAGRVYVADAPIHRVQIFSASGAYVATLGQPDTSGPGNNQFNYPNGVAVDPSGTIYVADSGNHRVQVFNSNRVYVATLGQTGVTGADNGHFNWPQDVATDSVGNVYVVDQNNHRVQIFDKNRSYVRTIGESSVSGNDFGHLTYPQAVAVDGAGRTYVADGWGGRVHVYDGAGGYLTTLASWGWGANCIECLDNANGLAVDSGGNLYIADRENHRVEKYAFGVPGWWQANINGFGNPANSNIHSLASFAGQLYAGTYNGSGAQMWKTATGTSWTQVITPGFGSTRTVGLNSLLPFSNALYAGVRNDAEGGKIYRSGDGWTWDLVATGGFTDTRNASIYRLAAFNGSIYAGTGNFTPGRGAEIWRSPSGDSGSWQPVVGSGFDNPNNYIFRTSEVYNGYLYFATDSVDLSTGETTTGGIVIRSQSGDPGSWAKVTDDGLGDVNNWTVSGLAAFNGYLYASTARWDFSGIQVWRCQACDDAGDWHKVVDNGFGNPNNGGVSNLVNFDGKLYVIIGNWATGLEVWSTTTGNSGEWTQMSRGGFGDRTNSSPYYNNVVVFNNHLFIGMQNGYTGGEIWQNAFQVFVPFARR